MKCRGCGRRRRKRQGARDYCGTCYGRWAYHGYPQEGPPSPVLSVAPAERAGRIEDFVELRSWGVSREEAARRLGVSLRTVERYDAALRAQGAAA